MDASTVAVIREAYLLVVLATFAADLRWSGVITERSVLVASGFAIFWPFWFCGLVVECLDDE